MDDGKQLEIIEQLIKMRGAKDLNSQNSYGSNQALNSVGYPQSSNIQSQDQNFRGYQYDEAKEQNIYDDKKKYEMTTNSHKIDGIDRIQSNNNNSNASIQETQQKNIGITKQNIQDQSSSMQINQQTLSQQQYQAAYYPLQGQKPYQQSQVYPQQQQQQQFYNSNMQQQPQYQQQYQYQNYNSQYPSNQWNSQQYYQQPNVYNYHQQYTSSQIPQQNYQQQNPASFQNPQNYQPYYQYQNQQPQPYYQHQPQQNVYQQQSIVGINPNSNYQTQYPALTQQINPPIQAYDQNTYQMQLQKQPQINQQTQQKQYGYNNMPNGNQNLPNNTYNQRDNTPINQSTSQNQQIILGGQMNNKSDQFKYVDESKQSISQRSQSQQNPNLNMQNTSSQKGYSKHYRNREDNNDQNNNQKLLHRNRRHNSREREISNEKLSSKNDIGSYQSIRGKRDNKSQYSNKKRGSGRYSSRSSSSSRSKSRSPTSSRSRSSSQKYSKNHYQQNKKNDSRSSSSEQSGSSFHSKNSRNNIKQNKQNKQKKNKSHSLNDLTQNNKKVTTHTKSKEKNPQIKKKIYLQNGNPISTVYSTEQNDLNDSQKKPEIQITKRSIKSINLSGSKINYDFKKIYIKQGQKEELHYQDSQEDEVKKDVIPTIEFNFKKEVPKLQLGKFNIFKNDSDDVNEETDDNASRNKSYQLQRGMKPQLSRQQLDQIKDSPQKYQEQNQANKISFSIDYNQLDNQDQNNQSDSQKKKLQNSLMYSYSILGKDKKGYSQTTYLQKKITKIIEEKEEQLVEEQQEQSNKINQQEQNQEDFTKDDVVGGGMNQNRYFCDKKGQICFKCGKPGHVRNACVMNEEKQVCNFCLGDHFMAKCSQKVCFKCGEIGHERNQCPVMNVDSNSSYNPYQKKRIPKCNNCTKMGHVQQECGIIRPNYDAKQELSFNYFISDYDLQNLFCLNCQQYGHISCYSNISIYDSVYSQEKLSNKIRQQLFKSIYNKLIQNKSDQNEIEEEEDIQVENPSQIDIDKEEKILDISIQKSLSESEAGDNLEELKKENQFLKQQNNELEEGEEEEEENESINKQQIYDQTSDEVIVKSPQSQDYTFQEKDVSQEDQFTDSIQQNNASLEGATSENKEKIYTKEVQNV